MRVFNRFKRAIGRRLADFLNQPLRTYERFSISAEDELKAVLKPGDVLLVEGNRRISIAIKYLTQSTWSHSCLYIGDALQSGDLKGQPVFIEADIELGVIAVPLNKYTGLNTRICRPIGLSAEDTELLVAFTIAQIGHQYDHKNMLDLMRYLLPTPPILTRHRRQMLALGSGDPTRAICSTLIAQAFQIIGYPILPRRNVVPRSGKKVEQLTEEQILQARHYSHFTPRDFDLSPYFAVVKPLLEHDFSYHQFGSPEKTKKPTLA